MRMVVPYAWTKILEQIKSVWLIVLYLLLFLSLVLRMPIAEATLIAVGLGVVIVGLSVFMEGLLLGLMPLGELIGLKLPQKSSLPTILIFAVVLGIGATFAEPAIGVLKAAGSSVSPWSAPLLFLLLNKYSAYLVGSVAAGVGIAVMFGMLRFLYGWSLKPFLYVLIGLLSVLTIYAAFDPNLRSITGLAWDCGAVTTGPVTVPLVLALGIGICRVAGKAGSENSGFGVVTLASLFPIIAVLSLGIALNSSAPSPMSEQRFFGQDNRQRALGLFENADDMMRYAFWNASETTQALMFKGGVPEMAEFLQNAAQPGAANIGVFGESADAVFRWAANKGSRQQRLAVFGSPEAVGRGIKRYSAGSERLAIRDLLERNALAASQAILPLTVFLVVVLAFVIRDELPRGDEIGLGVLFALVGMTLFSVGIEIGLGKLGTQVGSKLPALFKRIPLDDQQRTIQHLERDAVFTAITASGRQEHFLYVHRDQGMEVVPFDESVFDSATGRYVYVPSKGPLFGEGIAGIIVVLFFAFFMGYGATLAEPALNALGITVEEMTVGTFRKSLLMQAVAVGVGVGIALGVAKIVWDLQLYWMLVPPYLLLLVVSWMSTEEFVNIGWDSAGVTTGPVTVPLVLAMGLGIGNQIGVTEGFGILAMASVCPILTVLLVGLVVTRERKSSIAAAAGAAKGSGQ
jgi:hypothetical protein